MIFYAQKRHYTMSYTYMCLFLLNDIILEELSSHRYTLELARLFFTSISLWLVEPQYFASKLLFSIINLPSTNTSFLILGNSTSRSSAGASRGVIRLYDGASTNYAVLNTNTLSATRTLHLPNSDGTLVTDSDVNTIVTTTFNNNATDYTIEARFRIKNV